MKVTPDPAAAYRVEATSSLRARRARISLLIVPLLALGWLLVAPEFHEGAARAGRTPRLVRSHVLARDSHCDHPPPSPFAYGWPLRPFDRQHPIRGNFGDPRTLTETPFGADTSRSEGDFSFHNGIDIAAPAGTPIYPVVSGEVTEVRPDEIVLRTDDARTFQYWHLIPSVALGERVIAGETVLGTIAPELDHVHLSEIDGSRAHNPVDPGHLEPYQDHTTPTVVELLFHDEQGTTISPERLRGRVFISADASDKPPVPIPGAWADVPVTPALVAWRLTTTSGQEVIPETVVADFRFSEPPNADFWRIYAAGTYQNFPVFAHHYFWQRPGRYLFNLNPTPLDTTQLPDGEYRITVDAADVCGNRGSFSETVRIANHPSG